jgi:hypothetical protein
MKARDVMNTRVTAATPRAIGRDLALQLLWHVQWSTGGRFQEEGHWSSH